MRCHLFSFGVVTALLFCIQRNEGAAITHENKSPDQAITDVPKSQDQDEELQLEKLKAQQGGNVAVYKSQVQTSTNINGKVKSVSEEKEQVKDMNTGKTLVQVEQETLGRQFGPNSKPDQIRKTMVDIPSKGVHRMSINRNGKPLLLQRSNENSRETTEDYYTPVQDIEYTPADMAEYIYRTGDEEGVTLAIEELMRGGVVSQNDAISFLEEVKMDLGILRARHEKNRFREVDFNGQQQESQEEKLADARLREQRRQAQRTQEMYREAVEEKRHMSGSKLEAFRRKGLTPENDVYDTKEMPPMEPDVDYEDVVERLRLADFLSKEFSLEEIIYQLARQMFAQSVLKGNSDAEDSLQRFSMFLQQEASRGRISPELQRKIIDVMLAALVDTIGEHPELMALQQDSEIPDFQGSHAKDRVSNKSKAAESSQSKQELLNRKTEKKEQRTLDKSFSEKSLPSKEMNLKNEPTKKA